MADVAVLFLALQQLTQQVQAMAEHGRGGGNGGGRQWDHLDRKVFDGNSKDTSKSGT